MSINSITSKLQPKRIVVASLFIEEAQKACKQLEKEFGDKANQSLFKELLKDRKEKVEAEKKESTQKAMDKDEKGTPSPFSKSTNPHPDPKRK